jgi:hypothetical protein
MENPKYPMSVEGVSNREIVQEHDVPIIDIIRHGETDYNERYSGKIEPTSPNFVLESFHLDLTDEGIETIRKTVRQLGENMDKDHEVVLLISSPSARTHSSLLVAADEFKKLGVQVLSERFSTAIATAEDVEKNIRSTWFSEEGKPLVSRQKAKTLAYKGYSYEQMGRGRYKQKGVGAVIDENFKRFLRHMANIYAWLEPETLKMLEGKRLRIVCFSHVEVPQDFLSSIFHFDNIGILARGQILEIVPESHIASGKDVHTKVKLYPIPHGRSRRPIEEGEAMISFGFRPGEGVSDSVLKAEEDRQYQESGYPYEDIEYELSRASVFESIPSVGRAKQQLAQLATEGAISGDDQEKFLAFLGSKADYENPEECEPLLTMLKRPGAEKEFALAYFKHNLNTLFDSTKRRDVIAKEAVQAVITDPDNSSDVTLFWTFAPYLFDELKGRGIEEKRAMRLILRWARTGVARYSPEREKKGKKMYEINLMGSDLFKAYSLSESQDDMSHIFTKQESHRIADLILNKNKLPE